MIFGAFISRYHIRAINWFIGILSVILLMASTSPVDEPVEKSVQQYLSAKKLTAHAAVTEDEYKSLMHVYILRDYQPVWIVDGQISLDAHFLLKTIRNGEHSGIRIPHLATRLIQGMDVQSNRQLGRLDVLLTLAYARYVEQIANGQLRGLVSDSLIPMRHGPVNGFDALQKALRSNNLFATLYQHEPDHDQYVKLREKLKELRQVADNGGWAVLPTTHILRPGIHDSRVMMLGKRLKISGDLDKNYEITTAYDKVIKAAVQRYQQRNGLHADGWAGRETLLSLNVPVEQRIQQIMLNMERWRALPRDLGQDHILVNTAGYELFGYKDNQQSLKMNVVVGEADWSTPELSVNLTELEVNPVWRVPLSIGGLEILPKVKKDVSYLKRNQYKVYGYVKGERRELDPELINWKQYSKDYFPFELVKAAGSSNPLGKVKFFIPNKHDVYLHDTSNRTVFGRADRNLSHGCVRVEKPRALMRFVLGGDTGWTNERQWKAWQSNETVRIKPGKKLPVHLAYLTAWVDETGQISFYKDIYNKDQKLVASLGVQG